MKKKIKLTQEAYACSGERRLHTMDGAGSIYALLEWYEASAEDADGNTYTVVWNLREDYDPETMEEDSACRWDTPCEVMRDGDGANVTDEVEIE